MEWHITKNEWKIKNDSHWKRIDWLEKHEQNVKDKWKLEIFTIEFRYRQTTEEVSLPSQVKCIWLKDFMVDEKLKIKLSIKHKDFEWNVKTRVV